jgi:hypothetical protein
MGIIRAAADVVLQQDNATAEVDCFKCRRRYTNVRFAA